MRPMTLAAAATALTIVVSPGNGHAAHTWTLHCAPHGGTLPGSAAACQKLATLKGDPFAPVPPGTMCSQIFGGPETAKVHGTFRGRKIVAQFNRRNGCEVARWNRLSFLFHIT
jgi:hypothetical protein